MNSSVETPVSHSKGVCSVCGMWLWLVVCTFAAGQSTGQSTVQSELPELRDPIEMLDVMQIGASQRESILDDRPIDSAEQEVLCQLLFRIPSFAQIDVERWRREVEAEKLIADPHTHRYQMFDVRGTATQLETVKMLPELVPRLRFSEYYRLTIEDGEHRFLVYCREVPEQWKPNLHQTVTLKQPIRANGLLLKRVHGKPTQLVFAASRIEWYPESPTPELHVSDDLVLLGQLGLDISRLSEVEHRARMGANDRECFYQMLAAVRLAEPAQLGRLGRREFDIARMIKQPESCAGELYTLSGVARRAVLIRVQDSDIQQRFGIDHYYEVEVFLSLDRNVRFTSADDKEGKLFVDYPFVVCVPDLPNSIEHGEDIRVNVIFSGFFLKLWAYRTEFMSGGSTASSEKASSEKLQLSPLLIGSGLELQRLAPPDSSQLELILALTFSVALLVTWLILWRTSVQDRKVSKQLFRRHEPKSGSSWDNL